MLNARKGSYILVKPLKILAVSVLLTAGLSIAAFAESGGAGIVTASSLNFRSEAGYEAEIRDTVPCGTEVLILDASDSEWYQVYFDGTIGYMAAEYLSVSETAIINFGTVVCGGNTLLKSTPDDDGDNIMIMGTGTIVQIIGVDGDYYYVSAGDYLGYITASAVDFTADAELPVSDADSGEIVSEAMNYLGVPYVYGGTSPSGFDCSGLVYYIYTLYDYTVNRTAASLMENGTEVEELMAGDLVFFANGSGGSVGHVGIYIGDGQFIHASSGSGQVIISSLDESYYSRYYCGARRIVEG